jgi:hypothetical protein
VEYIFFMSQATATFMPHENIVTNLSKPEKRIKILINDLHNTFLLPVHIYCNRKYSDIYYFLTIIGLIYQDQ